MINIISCNFQSQKWCKQIFSIRHDVFVIEQQVSREEEFDEYEKSSIHYLGFFNELPAGTARWRVTENGIKLERFAVLKEFRMKGVANAILHKVLEHVVPTGAYLYLNAQVTAVGFYEKNGFKKEGPMFTEANIDHFKMYYLRD